MNAGGQLAGLNFPDFPDFPGFGKTSRDFGARSYRQQHE